MISFRLFVKMPCDVRTACGSKYTPQAAWEPQSRHAGQQNFRKQCCSLYCYYRVDKSMVTKTLPNIMHVMAGARRQAQAASTAALHVTLAPHLYESSHTIMLQGALFNSPRFAALLFGPNIRNPFLDVLPCVHAHMHTATHRAPYVQPTLATGPSDLFPGMRSASAISSSSR